MSDAPTGPSRSDGFRVAVIAAGEDRAGVAGTMAQKSREYDTKRPVLMPWWICKEIPETEPPIRSR